MRTALVFGYGQKMNGEIDEQTRNRCEKAVKLYRQGKIQTLYLTAATGKASRSMADEMAVFLVSCGIPRKNIVVDRRGGNTAGEIDIFLSRLPDRTRIVFISTWYHLPRIMWLALWRTSLSFRVSPAWGHAHFKADVLMEFAKMVNALRHPINSAKVYPGTPPVPAT